MAGMMPLGGGGGRGVAAWRSVELAGGRVGIQAGERGADGGREGRCGSAKGKEEVESGRRRLVTRSRVRAHACMRALHSHSRALAGRSPLSRETVCSERLRQNDCLPGMNSYRRPWPQRRAHTLPRSRKRG